MQLAAQTNGTNDVTCVCVRESEREVALMRVVEGHHEHHHSHGPDKDGKNEGAPVKNDVAYWPKFHQICITYFLAY